MAKPRLSLCVIFKNEMAYLPQCIESVRELCDEFVLVDSGSSDGSEIWAKDFCKEDSRSHYYKNAWTDGFATQRNFAISKASGDWILFLDADERLDPKAKDPMRSAIEVENVFAYYLPIRNYTYDFQEWGYQPPDLSFPDYPYGFVETGLHRLFRRDTRIQYAGILHERIEKSVAKHNLPVGRLNSIIHHIGKLKERDHNLYQERYAFYEKLAVKRAALEPQDSQAHWELGVILQKQRKLPEAEKAFSQAYAIDSENEELESSYLMALYQQGKIASLLAINARSDRGRFFVLLAQAQGHPQQIRRLLEFKDSIHQSSLFGLELALRCRDKALADEFRNLAQLKFKGLGIVEYLEGRNLRLKGEYERAIPLLKESLSSGYSAASVELFISWMKLNQPQDLLDYANKFPENQSRHWPTEAKKILELAEKLSSLS